ncbi:MAG: sulfurtransferase [Flavobacteriales bacterium]
MNGVVSVNWLNQNLNDENLLILDASITAVSDESSIDWNHNTIPHSRYFDLKHNFSDENSRFPNMLPSPEKFELEARKIGVNNNSKIVIFDNKGIYSSPRVWWMFKIMGHKEVYVLNGGLPEWKSNEFYTEKRKTEQFRMGDFKVNFQLKNVKTYEDVLENIFHPSFLIIDARSKGRFIGKEKEPRKGLKSGSIPNSVNLPYQEVLKDGKFKSKLEIIEIFKNLIGTKSELVFSCGSGLTACVVMLAYEIAINECKQIYDGSWTEWAEKQNLKII